MGHSFRSGISSLGLSTDDSTSSPTPPKAAGSQAAGNVLALLRQTIDEGSQTPGAILQATADAARILVSASGVAIALRTKGIVVCRARSGDPTPDLGSPVNTESGISGECLRTASILVCHDSENDSRVDAEVCREMGIRSIVVVPLRGPSGMAGILEAFSTRPRAFGDEQINALRDLAQVAESAYERECRNLKEATFASIRSARTRILATSVPKDDPVADKPLLEEPSSARRYWILGAAAVAVLLVAGVWLSSREPASEAAAPASASKVQHASTTLPPQTSQPVPPSKPRPGITPLQVRQDPAPGALKNAAEITVETADASRPAQISPVREAEIPSTTKTSTEPNTNSIVEPPSVNIGTQDSTKQLAALADAPNAMPTLETRISQGTTGGELIRKVNPVYPMQAREQRLAGSVTLEITIGKDGVVHEIKQVSGSPVLVGAASDAIHKWRYNPFLLNGIPVQVTKQITVLFKLP